MKNRILVISTALLFGACANLTPAQQTTLSDVTNTALAAGLGYLSGGIPGAIANGAPLLVNDISDAATAIRSKETGATAAPSAGQITAALSEITASAAVTNALGPKIAPIVAAAVTSGATPDDALEAAAVGLDKAAGAASTK